MNAVPSRRLRLVKDKTIKLPPFDALRESMTACYKVGVFLEAEAISKDPALYFRGRWNVLDVLAFVTILGGFLARIVDSHGPWGRALYALSAPPMFTRILTLAQILPFQGPMIKVSFTASTKRQSERAFSMPIQKGFQRPCFG